MQQNVNLYMAAIYLAMKKKKKGSIELYIRCAEEAPQPTELSGGSASVERW